MSANKFILNNGIVIEDYRQLGCGIRITDQHTKFMSLGYSDFNGFYLIMSGRMILMDDYPAFFNELETMRLALVEATELLKEKN